MTIALGEYAPGDTITFDFTTASYGVPTTLAGTPALSVYKDSTTETTTGPTLTVDYDSRTGMHHVSLATSDAFYAINTDYSVVITTGTVGGVSVVGYVVARFRLSSRIRNIKKAANAIARGTVTTGASTTSLPTSTFDIAGAAASGVVADQFVARVVLFDGDTTTAGLRGAAVAISASTASNTPTLTVDTLPATPASGDTFSII